MVGFFLPASPPLPTLVGARCRTKSGKPYAICWMMPTEMTAEDVQVANNLDVYKVRTEILAEVEDMRTAINPNIVRGVGNHMTNNQGTFKVPVRLLRSGLLMERK